MVQRFQGLRFLALSAVLLSPCVAAGADINQFLLAGVKLGMSPDEARLAASKSLQINESELKFSPAISDPLMGKPLSKSLSYAGDDLELMIGFEVTNPKDRSSPLVVGFVSFEPLNAAQASKLRDFAIKTYGEPTDRSMESGNILLWCSKPEEGICRGDQPGLSYSEGLLMLVDPRLKRSYHDAFGEMLHLKESMRKR